jgi:hypothetical protein
MNKKLTIPIFLLLIGGVAFGALVTVISNTITYRMTTDLPFQLTIVSPTAGDLGTVYGGDTKVAVYRVENRANNPVNAVNEIVIYGPSDLDGSEITSMEFSRDGTDYVTLNVFAIEDRNGDGKADIVYRTDAVSYNALSSEDNYLRITFNPAIEPGDYSFDVKLLP